MGVSERFDLAVGVPRYASGDQPKIRALARLLAPAAMLVLPLVGTGLWLRDPFELSLALGTVLIAGSGLAAARARVALSSIVTGLCFAITTLLCVVTCRTSEPMTLAWLALVPSFAFYFGDLRRGLLWFVVSLGATVACAAYLLVTPSGLADEHLAVRLVHLLMLVVVLAGLGLAVQYSRDQTLHTLEQAREKAEHANAGKTRFLAAISHDIRTPLNGILGTAELALTFDELPARTREHLQIIQESGATLVALINDVLDVARAEAGRLEISPRPFKPKRVALEVVALHQARAQAKGLRLQASCVAPDDVLLLADSVRLRQVLHNLISNAVKFTERGGTIAVEGLVVPVSGNRYKLIAKVSDSGRGLTPSEIEMLFQPFSQARASDAHQGTGLGLTISRQLGERMGGTLTVTSELNRGSTFTVEIELERASEVEPTPLPVDLRRSASAPSNREGRVLVVDDNSINVKVAVGMLHRLGVKADSATSAIDALGLLEQRGYDLVLMDLQMPEVDGAEATRRLRQREGTTHHTPVVAVTASALPEELASCRDAGMDETLTKPLQLVQLLKVLDTFLPAAHPPPNQ